MKRILLIDDESVMTDSIQDGLDEMKKKREIESCDVDHAIDFYTALEYLDNVLNEENKTAYDLIISDLLMPPAGLGNIPPQERRRGAALNGWIFLKHYILNPTSLYYNQHRQTKIIIFSAYLERLSSYYAEIGFNWKQYQDRLLLVYKGNIFDETGGLNRLMKEIKACLQTGGGKL